MKKLIWLTQTCEACPSQWEGELEDSGLVYIRYRYGNLTVEVDGESILDFSFGGGMDGVMDLETLITHTNHILDYSEVYNEKT